jgi:hypothetical protein
MDETMLAHYLADVSKNKDAIVHKWRQLYRFAKALYVSLFCKNYLMENEKLKPNTLNCEHNRSLSKANNSITDFDRIIMRILFYLGSCLGIKR